MPLTAAIGQAFGPSGRAAGKKAAQQALEGVGRNPLALAWVFAAHDYPLREVVEAVADVLGEAPLLGFSTSGVWPASGSVSRSVVVALLAGEGVEGRADWWSGYVSDSAATVQAMVNALQPEQQERSALLVVTDGLGGNIGELETGLPPGNYKVAGCMAGGNIHVGRTYQAGGRQSGAGGLAAALLSGDVQLGAGAAHGWHPLGAITQLTQIQGLWVRALNGRRPSQVYADLFAVGEKEWAFPPLNGLVRLYPLGIVQGDEVIVRSPVRVEADGSLRMNTHLNAGQDAHVMVGSISACLDAARQATRQALTDLGNVQPVLAVVLVDAAWQALLVANPGAEFEAVRQELALALQERAQKVNGGEKTQVFPQPLVCGAYTFGQIVAGKAPAGAQALNQHIAVLLFADRRLVV